MRTGRLLRTTEWVAIILGITSFLHVGAGGAATLTITNQDRPVMQAILDLMAQYGYVITYEEPRYVYQGDLKDVTQKRRDLSRFPPGEAPKVFRVRGGDLQLSLPTGNKIGEQTMADVLKQLVQSWSDSNQGGSHFSVEQQDGVFHVLPTEVRDANGNWKVVQSILALPISVPNASRTEVEMFRTICGAISTNVATKVVSAVNGGFVMGIPDQTQYVLGAQDEAAASVLTRAFKVMGKKMTWILTYEPTTHVFFLNIDDVRTMPKPMIWPPS